MNVAVLSDTHDHLDQLAKALAAVRDSGAEALVFCGDFCAPFTLAALAEGYAGPIHAVFGNNDGDRMMLLTIASQHPHVCLHGEIGRLELGGRQAAIVHYTDLGHDLAASGSYDVVFCGHTHVYETARVGPPPTLVVNPGEVMGRLGAPSWALVDLAALTVHQHRL